MGAQCSSLLRSVLRQQGFVEKVMPRRAKAARNVNMAPIRLALEDLNTATKGGSRQHANRMTTKRVCPKSRAGWEKNGFANRFDNQKKHFSSDTFAAQHAEANT